MFDTPQEAALKAENARLRAENEYLRSAVESPTVTVKPYAVEEEMMLTAKYRKLTLPRAAGVRGRLQDDGRWNVLAFTDRLDGAKDLVVEYYCEAPGTRRHMDDWTFVNDILPRMHEKFIRILSDIYVKQLKG
jgi:hypothetical protein